MPSTSDRRTVALNAVSGNVLAGKQFEFAPAPSIVRFFCVAAAVGIFATISVGGVIVVNDEEISAANRFPIDPDDQFTAIGANFGDRLLVSYRNSTGAGISVTTLVKIDPL